MFETLIQWTEVINNCTQTFTQFQKKFAGNTNWDRDRKFNIEVVLLIEEIYAS